MKTKTFTSFLCLAAAITLPASAQARETARERPKPEARAVEERPTQNPRSAAKPWLIGVMVDSVDPLLRSHLKLPKGSGVVVSDLVGDGPAAKSGIRKGDLILAAQGKPVVNLATLREAVTHSAKLGKPLVLHVLKAGEKKEIRIMPPLRESAVGTPRPPRPTPPVRPMAGTPGGRAAVPDSTPPARPMPGPAPERMIRALREMQADLDKQRETIRRLEKRVDELSRDSRERRRN